MARPKPRSRFFRRLMSPIKGLRDLAAETADRGMDRARDRWHDMRHRYSGFRTRQEMNARFLRDYGRYWQGKAGKQMRRKLGRDQDSARRHARGWREASGLADHRGRATPRSRSRPELPARPRLGDLRDQHRHHKDHDRADAHDRKAKGLRDRGKDQQAGRHEQKAKGLRDRHPARQAPARPAPSQSRPAPARPRPAPARPGPAPQGGRLAPGNGRRPAPQPASRPARTRP